MEKIPIKEKVKPQENPEQDHDKFKKIHEVMQIYYSRKDIQQAIFDFCQNRETVPRYGEGFGKRPDMLDYPSDILNYVKKGATSFHCSEELWNNPLDISLGAKQAELNQLKAGWDFLIDIDSKYFDYSKLAADLLIKALEYHGVNNIGIKYSGSKGLHILVPWKAFPKEFNGIQTKNMFPEWPRVIAQYLHELIQDKLNERIMATTSKAQLEEKGELITRHLCSKCKIEVEKKTISKYICTNQRCKSEVTYMKSNRKITKCPSCQCELRKLSEDTVFICPQCKSNSVTIEESKSNYGGESRNHDEPAFSTEETTKSQKDSVDFVLVSPRHLFRAPYSLHEKTALASVVIDKKDLQVFHPSMADPMKITPKSYNPNCQEGEARELLSQALDWAKKKEEKKKFEGTSIDVKNLTIKEEMYPECIKKIMAGQKQDGRKRALFVLLAFFRSLELPKQYIETKADEWNKKNYQPLKEGYINSQIDWIMRNKIMPPNCQSNYYKDLGISCNCQNIKNPISFTIKQALRYKSQGNK